MKLLWFPLKLEKKIGSRSATEIFNSTGCDAKETVLL